MTNIIRISIRKLEIKDHDPMTNFCRIIGIHSNNKDNTPVKIVELLYKYHQLNSTELSRLTNKSRGAILNHLENLMECGVVFKYGKNYQLIDSDFSKIVDNMERNINQTISRLKKIAYDLDQYM